MQTRVRKWGNGPGIRIPAQLSAAAGIDDNTMVEIECDNKTIRIRSVKPTLQELVAQITDDNRHEEVDWGSPEGSEATSYSVALPGTSESSSTL